MIDLTWAVLKSGPTLCTLELVYFTYTDLCQGLYPNIVYTLKLVVL
jgi:hypothetical protein